MPYDNQVFFSLLISNHGHYCWCFRNPVKLPVKFGSLCHYLQGFIHLQVVCGISEQSTVSSIHVIKSRKSWILSSSTGWSFNHLIFTRCFSYMSCSISNNEFVVAPWLGFLLEKVWKFSVTSFNSWSPRQRLGNSFKGKAFCASAAKWKTSRESLKIQRPDHLHQGFAVVILPSY